MKGYYFANDVERVTGVKRIRLQQWLKAGYLTPSIEKASGYGTRNVFSLGDLYKILLFKQLVESGVDRERASLEIAPMESKDFNFADKEYLSFATDLSTGHTRSSWIVAGNNKLIGGSILEDFKEGFDCVKVFDLSKIIRTVNDAVK